MTKSGKIFQATLDHEIRSLLLENSSLFSLVESMGIRGVFGRKTIREVCREQNLHERVVLPLFNSVVEEDFQLHDALPAYGVLQLCDWLQAFGEIIRGRLLNLKSQYKESGEASVLSLTLHLEELNTRLLPHVREVYELYYSPDYTTGKRDLLAYSAEFFPANPLPFESLLELENQVEIQGTVDELFVVHALFHHLQALERLEQRLLIPVAMRMEEDIVTTFQKHKTKPLRIGFLQPEEQPESNTPLSRRESEVLQLLAKGLKNKEIADALSISLTTVISHRKHIVERLGIKSLAGLTVYAYLHGLLESEILTNED